MSIYTRLSKYANSRNLSHELIQKGPEYVLNFIQEAFSGEVPQEELLKVHEFWSYLAWLTTKEAIHRAPPVVDLEWARVTNTLYAFLEALPGKNMIMRPWMLFKVELVNSMSDRLDKSLADPNDIVHWALNNLTISYDEMNSLLMLDPVQIETTKRLEMLQIKERLEVASYLEENQWYQRPEELVKWIKLFGIDKNVM